MPYKDPKKQAACTKLYYENNKKKRKAQAAAHRKLTRKLTRQWLWDYLLAHSCVDCGEGDPVVLEFDHVRGEKEFNIGNAARDGRGVKRVEIEVEKCDVRCANCHRRKTAKQFGWHKDQIESQWQTRRT